MRHARFATVSLLALIIAVPSLGPAQAQDATTRSMLDRLDRLEKDLNQVQRQIYRHEVGGGPAPVAPVGGDSPALNLEIRITQLEDQMRRLTGQLEEIQYQIAQVGQRLDKQQADDEVRFQALESAAPPPGPAPKPGQPHGAANMDQPAPKAGVLTPPPDARAAPAAAPPVATTTLPSGTIQEQYSYAFGLLRQQDFPGAEQAFKQFLQKHPNDPLAANAQYWLGESYFVREDFQSAAAAFAEGYSKFPQGAKASDDLLKLGIALGKLGRKQDACFSFARLERDFPSLPAVSHDRELAEKKHLGC